MNIPALKTQLNKLIKSKRSSTFFTVAFIPWLLCASYYIFFAADRFVSTASFKIHDSSSNTVDLSASAAFAAAVGVSNTNDEYIIQNYINSIAMLESLDQTIELRQHYSQHPDADWISRLTENATLEEFSSYYQNHIDMSYDEYSGLLIIEVQAYSASYAKKLLANILKLSEDMVNNKSLELASSQLNFVQQEINKSATRLNEKRQVLTNFQNTHALFNPEQQGIAVSSIIGELQQRLSSTEVELSVLQQYQHNSAPQVIALNQKAKSLKAQINQENQRLVNKSDERPLNELFGEFKALEMEVLVAQQSYTSALGALELARMDTAKKLKHLVVISPPYVAEEASYPRKIYNLTTLAAVLLMLFGLTRMILTTIREHQD